MINAATPTGRPRGGFSEMTVLKRPCPAVPRRGPEAGNIHRIIMMEKEGKKFTTKVRENRDFLV
jgi:hypothetical protein